MKRINLVLFIVLFFSFCNIHALEFCKESKEHEEYMKLDEEERSKYIEPYYCDLSSEYNSKSRLLSFSSELKNYVASSYTDSSYNSYTNNLVTNPKNQGSLGTCWAFSATSVVESNALKNNVGRYDFSESHMIYSLLSAGYSDNAGKIGKYNVSNFDGGKITFAASYYFNNYGQLLESEMPYVDEETTITSSQYKKGRNIVNVADFGLANLTSFSACSSTEITNIKKKIINYGSVQASMYMDESLFKDSNNDYYMATTSNSALANHGITIVGWDDNISKSNFTNATRNGAWIIKNSWGTSWSNDGFFYISYDDHFICKSTASFYNVSTISFDHTYASADMVGVPTFNLPSTFYISSRFTKQGDFEEQIKRVSVAVGPNLTYKVYLSKSNTLNSKSDWIQLANTTSDEYGIKSVNVSNITVDSDFTIIVEYDGGSSSIFTMCNNMTETSNMEYSSGTNYYSSTGNSWSDMNSMNIQGNITSCEPNIYVYTDEVDAPESYVVINSISVSNSTATANINIKNIDTSSITYTIKDASNNNVTSRFSIIPNYSSNKITIRSDGYTSGRFTLLLSYNGETTSKSFEFVEKITSNNTSVVTVSSTNLFVNITNNFTLTYGYLMNYLNVTNSTYTVYSSSNEIINNNSATLTTNSKIKLNNKTYNIVILGDVTCDGKITALDYIEVRKHIMGTKITDSGKLLASDMNKDSKISALDYIGIRKILMR